ncbi:MAG: hypothetical protein Q8N18_14015 [Opitutaceae bacterium]|nr:hypothetical protein [Opitutaceae bacterium]
MPATTSSRKLNFIAALLLAALFGLLASHPARAAEPFRLDRIGVVRFTAESDGTLRRQNAVLHADGRLSLRAASTVPRPANTPAFALGRNLVPAGAWQAYHALGTGALQQFELHDGGAQVHFGGEAFLLVAPNFEGPLAVGRVINLSARMRIGAGQPGVAGFVIAEHARHVLIRAVGPTLQKFGVGNPAPDPFLSVQRNGQTIYFNDDWNEAPEATAIRDAAVRVGAFPLDEGSYDAARLIELPPGAYTVSVQPYLPDSPGGDVLLEIYSVPPDVVEIQPTSP